MTGTALPFRRRLGPYEIVSLLGAGGMGEVYRARDPRLRRDVAIKVLPAGYAGDLDLLKRLEREARAISQLNHPNIVAVYDVGSQDGVEYIVMELLEGETLGTLLNAGSLSPRRALEYATQIARGLAAAHEKNIVHRDLKPENVMVGAFGAVLVMDWGVARAAGEDDRLIVGTPGYMPPEQLRGDGPDARADVFALGAILRFLLHGDEIPRPLAAVIGRAMNEDAQARYADARELAEDVLRFLDQEPVSAYRESILERAGRWIGRHRALLTLIAAYIVMRVIVFLWIRL
jgi:serine/threonine protein kinase